MSVFFASTEEKLAVQNLGILFIPCSLTYQFFSGIFYGRGIVLCFKNMLYQ
jgi:hypothetical protein